MDESILESLARGKSPTTLRFYGWSPSAVSIGYFQNIREEVNLDRCFLDGVDVVRRITGGGAVYHAMELTYSYIAPEDTVPDDILESYRLICAGLVGGFKHLGVTAEFAPLNDIVSGGKKISGNAQTRRSGCVLQHGTVLLGVDLKRMFTYLLVPDEKTRDKAIKDVRERVTSLRDVLKKDVPYGKVADAMKNGFAEALNLELVSGKPTKDELAQAEELQNLKYTSLEWNGRR